MLTEYNPRSLFWHYAFAFRGDVSDYLSTLFLDTASELSKLKNDNHARIEKIPQTAELFLDASTNLRNGAESGDDIDVANCGQFVCLMERVWPLAEDERDVKKISKNYSERLRGYGLEMLDPRRIPQEKLNELEHFCLNLIRIENSRADPLPTL